MKSMKNIISILLTLIIFFNLVPSTFASTNDENLNNNLDLVYEENYSDAARQLELLYELGYIEEIVTEESLKEAAQVLTLDNDEVLSEGTYLVGIDTSKQELIDTNEIIEEATLRNSSSVDTNADISELKSSLLWYTVAFKTWITGAETTSSKVNHSVEVTGVFGVGARPTNYTIQARIKRATSQNGSYSDAVNQTKTVGLKSVVTVSTPIASTYFWKSDSDAWANYPDGSFHAEAKQEGPWLLNKKGLKYPEYTDPVSGKVLAKPASTTWSKTSTAGCALTSSERTTYRDWYDNKYKPLDWVGNYEIHHVKPCLYGGNKDYSNLIVLPKSFHRSVVSPWWTNY